MEECAIKEYVVFLWFYKGKPSKDRKYMEGIIMTNTLWGTGSITSCWHLYFELSTAAFLTHWR